MKADPTRNSILEFQNTSDKRNWSWNLPERGQSRDRLEIWRALNFSTVVLEARLCFFHFREKIQAHFELCAQITNQVWGHNRELFRHASKKKNYPHESFLRELQEIILHQNQGENQKKKDSHRIQGSGQFSAEDKWGECPGQGPAEATRASKLE